MVADDDGRWPVTGERWHCTLPLFPCTDGRSLGSPWGIDSLPHATSLMEPNLSASPVLVTCTPVIGGGPVQFFFLILFLSFVQCLSTPYFFFIHLIDLRVAFVSGIAPDGVSRFFSLFT